MTPRRVELGAKAGARPSLKRSQNRGKQGAAARRGAWAIASEAIDSASNLFLTIWIARAVTPSAFGAFGAVYVSLQVALLTARSIGCIPLLIEYPAIPSGELTHAVRRATGATCLFGVAVAAVGLVVGGNTHGPLRLDLIAMAIAAPGMLLQDCCCYVYIARRAPHLAFVNQIVWFVPQVVASVIVAQTAHPSAAWPYILIWGFSAWISAIAALAQLRLAPDLIRAHIWASRHRRRIIELAADSTIGQGAQFAVVYVLGGALSLAAVGAFRAAQTPYGVLRSLFQGVVPIGIAEGARLRQGNTAKLRRWVYAVAATAVLAVVVFALVLQTIPSRAGHALLGSSWGSARPLFTPIALVVAGNSVALCAQTGLRAAAATRALVTLRVPITLLQYAGLGIGLVVGGINAAVTGLGIGAVAGGAVGMWVLRGVVGASDPELRKGEPDDEVASTVGL